MSTHWYYLLEGQDEEGPVSIIQLKALRQQNILKDESKIRHAESDRWILASQMPDLDTDKPTRSTASPTSASEGTPQMMPPPLPSRLEPEQATDGSGLVESPSEFKAIYFAVGRQATCLGRWVSALLARKRLQHAQQEAKVNFGRALLTHQLADLELRQKALELEDRIESVRAANSSDKQLQVERDGLLVRLADSYELDPNEKPPAEISHEFQQFAQARQQAQANADTIQEQRTELFSPEPPRLRRAAIGAAVVMLMTCATALMLVLGISLFATALLYLRSPTEHVTAFNDEARIAKAVGLVVCGAEVITPAGEYSEVPLSQGSCFSVTEDGYLITNKHVVEDIHNMRRVRWIQEEARRRRYTIEPQVWVVFGEGRKHRATIEHVSEDHDLAVLKIDTSGLPVFRLHAEQTPARASLVFACGFPAAAQLSLSADETAESLYRAQAKTTIEKQFKLRDFDYVLTSGSVSRVTSEQNGREWVQHDAAIHGGNSGGPLVDENGVVVGINTSKHPSAAGLSYAIFLPQLREELDEQIPGLNWQ